MCSQLKLVHIIALAYACFSSYSKDILTYTLNKYLPVLLVPAVKFSLLVEDNIFQPPARVGSTATFSLNFFKMLEVHQSSPVYQKYMLSKFIHCLDCYFESLLTNFGFVILYKVLFSVSTQVIKIGQGLEIDNEMFCINFGKLNFILEFLSPLGKMHF